ncbi:hypothetical protein L873DRAFT_1814052 [Choiromyces venosus 120613-1]|uniref:Uncharacterized protein n=1 Tax=Choiromyces venosus 120613-1 TaxID=1336337 RepID=A0A3N4J8E4_9PEZI|nr:hypothetical protein L873DRAFT_1814052 [Choiromyces venosus 120613-1]
MGFYKLLLGDIPSNFPPTHPLDIQTLRVALPHSNIFRPSLPLTSPVGAGAVSASHTTYCIL